MQIELNISEMLPIIRKAFDNKELQYQKEKLVDNIGPSCLYSGPCAIGVCLTKEQRKYCDSESHGDTSVGYLLAEEIFIANEDEADDLRRLQEVHDTQITYFDQVGYDDIPDFEKFLSELEKKYLA